MQCGVVMGGCDRLSEPVSARKVVSQGERYFPITVNDQDSQGSNEMVTDSGVKVSPTFSTGGEKMWTNLIQRPPMVVQLPVLYHPG